MAEHVTPVEQGQEAWDALHKMQERYQLALMAGGLGSWELHLQTMTLESSDTCKRNFGLAPEVELPYSRLMEMMLPEDRPAMQASVGEAIETGSDYRARYRIQRPDGKIRWIAAYGRPFFADDGTPDIMLGTTQDITDRVEEDKERERLLTVAQQARTQAERAVSMRNDFLSSTVHDLRTPLTTMRGRTQLLQRRLARVDLADDDRHRIEDGLAQLEASAAQMESILAELQDVAFLQIGRPLELRCVPVDLVALVRAAIEAVEAQSEEHRFRLETPHPELVVVADATRMERVIDNLLSNAVKYSPQGGVVTVRLHQDNGWILLSVTDEGVGIPASELELIFERFHRASNVTGTFQGTGIGLAGARSIVEQHDGTLTVESEEGRGSTFTVRLPNQMC